MPTPTIHKAEAFEDSGISLMARVVGAGSTAIAQAEFTSITYCVYDTAAPSTAIISAGTSVTISDVVFDTLQTDGRWTRDATGYNFRYDVGSSELPDGNKTYRVEVKFTPSSGSPFHIGWEVKTKDLLGS